MGVGDGVDGPTARLDAATKRRRLAAPLCWAVAGPLSRNRQSASNSCVHPLAACVCPVERTFRRNERQMRRSSERMSTRAETTYVRIIRSPQRALQATSMCNSRHLTCEELFLWRQTRKGISPGQGRWCRHLAVLPPGAAPLFRRAEPAV